MQATTRGLEPRSRRSLNVYFVLEQSAVVHCKKETKLVKQSSYHESNNRTDRVDQKEGDIVGRHHSKKVVVLKQWRLCDK